LRSSSGGKKKKEVEEKILRGDRERRIEKKEGSRVKKLSSLYNPICLRTRKEEELEIRRKKTGGEREGQRGKKKCKLCRLGGKEKKLSQVRGT